MVILVIGILAAIALPTFLGQSSKANDADAKQQVKTMLTTMRICGIDQGGSFTDPQPCNLKRLQQLEPSIPDSGATANPNKPAGGFTVKTTSDSGNTFTMTRYADGSQELTCKAKDKNEPGGCVLSKGKNGTW